MAEVTRRRERRVMTSLSRDEYAMLDTVRRLAFSVSGIDSDSEALRFLIRNWKRESLPICWRPTAEEKPLTDRVVLFRCAGWPPGVAALGRYKSAESASWDTEETDLDGNPRNTYYGDEVAHWLDIPRVNP